VITRGFDEIKAEWMAHDDWQFADRDAAWRFFCEQGFRLATETLRAEADRYGIGSMCSQWTADDVADDLLECIGLEVKG